MRCTTDTCEKKAAWRPVLDLRSKCAGPATRLRFTTLVMCDEHHLDRSLDDFLSIEGFEKLTKHMREAGKMKPIRKFTTLAWEPISQSEEVTPNDLKPISLDDEALP